MFDRVELTQIMSDALGRPIQADDQKFGEWVETAQIPKEPVREVRAKCMLNTISSPFREEMRSFFALSSTGSRGLCGPFSSSLRGA
jgi:hypothetical protein